MIIIIDFWRVVTHANHFELNWIILSEKYVGLREVYGRFGCRKNVGLGEVSLGYKIGENSWVELGEVS